MTTIKEPRKPTIRFEELNSKLEILMKLGNLSEYERKILKILLIDGKKSAGELAKTTSVPQPKIYAAVDKLCERKLAFCPDENARPKVFVAIRPEFVIEQLTKPYVNLLTNDLKTLQDHLIEVYEASAGSGSATLVQSYAKIHDSMPGVVSELYEIIQSASKQILAVGGDFSWLTENQQMVKIMKHALSKKVIVRLIAINGGKGMSDVCIRVLKDLMKEGIEINQTTEVSTPCIIIDTRETILAIRKKPTRASESQYVFVRIMSEAVSKDMSKFLQLLWMESQKWDVENK